jgi:hypothetical protein
LRWISAQPKRQIDQGTEGCEAQALCSENEPSAVNAFTDSEARVGDNRVPELDYLSKLRKEPQVNEETEEEREKLALELNDC